MNEGDDHDVATPYLPARADAAVLGLKPIPADLEPDVVRFVTELRRIYGQLEVTLRSICAHPPS